MHRFPLFLVVVLVLNVCRVSSQRPQLVRELLPDYTLSPSSRFSGCSFTGTQPISIQWRYQGNRLSSGPSGGPYFTNEGVLVLENAGPGDSGNYTCIGSNRLGTSSASTTITIAPEESASVAGSWFMLFVYAVLVWLGSSSLVAVWMGCQWRRAKHHKPPPVDRNECFAIDHGGVMVSEQRPHSRVSGEYSVFGGGYPNPAYSSGTTQQEESTFEELVDYNSRDGTVTRTTTALQKEYYYIPPQAAQALSARQLGRSGNPRSEKRRDSKRDSGTDPKLRLSKLRLVEEEETVIG